MPGPFGRPDLSGRPFPFMQVHVRASLVLVFACACWAFSFPIMKALGQVGMDRQPSASSLFLSFLCVAIRFTAAGLVLGLSCLRARPLLTRLECEQGVGIGVMGGIGLVLQMDGMSYTLASTSAFLTQAYCVVIPLWLAIVHRTFPVPRVVGACVLTLAGAAVLAGLGTEGFEFGRGEWETLAGSLSFTGQILWLERPRYRGNRARHSTVLMFLVMAATAWPFALMLAPGPGGLMTPYASPQAVGLLAVLVGLCTLVTFPLAVHWQPKVSATQAGLLYCTEPIFTSVVALFVPGWISAAAGLGYPNETLSINLVAGGLLILVANGWLVLRPPPTFDGAARNTN